jgi:peptide-methionine (R)-S-oxide reductase
MPEELTERVLREGFTEPPFSGKWLSYHGQGTFVCAGCGAPLFSGKDKFDSGTGWPSFTRPLSDHAVTSRPDFSHGMVRTEVLCASCGGHLGHVFEDGPPPTGLRYCINSAALELEDDESP